MASRREEWAGRVAAWRRSGQTAKVYAKSIGVNAGTLAYWAWRLGREQRRKPSTKRRQAALNDAVPALIEVVKTGGGTAHGFEIQLRSGYRVQVAVGFDAAALKRLIAVLEGPA
jgi:transposase